MSLEIPASIPATLIPGDGIGPEVIEAVVEILGALGRPFTWDRQEGGMTALAKFGDALPDVTLNSVRHTRLALKGPLTTPIGRGFRSVNGRSRNGQEPVRMTCGPATRTLLPFLQTCSTNIAGVGGIHSALMAEDQSRTIKREPEGAGTPGGAVQARALNLPHNPEMLASRVPAATT